MRDGLTRKIPAADKRPGFDSFISGHGAELAAAGSRSFQSIIEGIITDPESYELPSDF